MNCLKKINHTKKTQFQTSPDPKISVSQKNQLVSANDEALHRNKKGERGCMDLWGRLPLNGKMWVTET